MAVHDYMVRGVEVVFGDESLHAAATKMAKHGVRFLPVVDGDELIGVLTEAQLQAARGRDPFATTVQEVMSYEVACCFDDEDERKLLAQMARRQLELVLVIDHQRRLLGMVTLRDLARAQRASDDEPHRPPLAS